MRMREGLMWFCYGKPTFTDTKLEKDYTLFTCVYFIVHETPNL